MRIEKVFERNTSCKSKVSRQGILILFQIGLLSEVEETQVSLERKPCMLGKRAYEILFPMRIELVSYKYFMQIIVFKVE
jgi:hypothetical protein